MSRYAKDIAAGSFFALVGAYFCISAWLNLPIGTAFRMGPGYFPLILGGVLVLLGVAIAVKAFFVASGPIEDLAWRGMLLIGLSPVIFGLTVRPLGLVPAIALSTLVGAVSSTRMRPLLAFGLTIGLTIFCVLVFYFGLGLPMRLFGPVLGNWGY